MVVAMGLRIDVWGRSPHGERGLKSYTSTGYVKREWSLPARGAWVEINPRRAMLPAIYPSLPARGAWVEIPSDSISHATQEESLPARGAWVEIAESRKSSAIIPSRSPHGERGLKSARSGPHPARSGSLPARGAWVEIFPQYRPSSASTVAPRTGSVG